MKRGALLKRYLSEQNGQLLGDIWTYILNVQSQANERIGYPTQKPEALLERIINMASNKGDTILDPFVGGGTGNVKQRGDFGREGLRAVVIYRLCGRAVQLCKPPP